MREGEEPTQQAKHMPALERVPTPPAPTGCLTPYPSCTVLPSSAKRPARLSYCAVSPTVRRISHTKACRAVQQSKKASAASFYWCHPPGALHAAADACELGIHTKQLQESWFTQHDTKG